MKDAPEIKGHHVLLKVGKRYDSRTLNFALKNALAGKPLNAEQRVIFISLYAQLKLHFERKAAKTKPSGESPLLPR